MGKQVVSACANCRIDKEERICLTEKGRGPTFCPTLNREDAVLEATAEYEKEEVKEFTRQASIQEAEGYATERVNLAKGEAARFNSLFDEYRKAKEVTRQRLYLETLNKVLPKVGKKLIVDEDVKGLIPLLDLKKEVTDEK